MHSKYMIIDGKELISGSYNLSMNSEHATFENRLVVAQLAAREGPWAEFRMDDIVAARVFRVEGK